MAAEATIVAPEPPAPPREAPAVPPAPAAGKAKGKADKGKADKGKADKGKGEKGKKDKKGANAPAADGAGPSVAGHPRAVRGIARAKAWGGLIGFVLGGYLAWPTLTPAEAAAHALVAGIVCYVVCWAGAVFVWRRIVILELKGREQELAAAQAAAAARSQLPAGQPEPARPR